MFKYLLSSFMSSYVLNPSFIVFVVRTGDSQYGKKKKKHKPKKNKKKENQS